MKFNVALEYLSRIKQIVRLVIIFPLAIGLQASPAENAKIYKSHNADYQATLTVAPYDNKGLFLIRFDGFESHFDKKVYLYKKTFIGGKQASGFKYVRQGSNAIHFNYTGKKTLIAGTIRSYYEAFVPGKVTTRMIFVKSEDPSAVLKLKKKYQLSQGLFGNKIATLKKVREAKAVIKKQCEHDIKVKIDWNSFIEKNQKITAGMSVRYIASLARICVKDADYKKAVKDIREVQFSYSKENSKKHISYKNNVLRIYVNQSRPNVMVNSYQHVVDAL